MSRVDDELGRRIRNAEQPVETARVLGLVARKRRRRSIATRVGNGALAVFVLTGTVAGYRVLDRAFGDRGTSTQPPASSPDVGGPVGEPVPGTEPDPGAAVQLDGVPFGVCRISMVKGNFGTGLDTVWVFEEEHTPGWGCDNSEGFQHLAVGSAGRVAIMSRRLTEVLDDGAWRVWAFAAPDLDGNGLDEVAIARQGGEPSARHLWFFRVADGVITPILGKCGKTCEPTPWNEEIGPISHENGVVADSGLTCGTLPGGRPEDRAALIYWQADTADPLHLYLAEWSFDGVMLEAIGESELIANGSVDRLLSSGLDELCGSSTNRTVDFPAYGHPDTA